VFDLILDVVRSHLYRRPGDGTQIPKHITIWTTFLLESLKERDNSEDLGTDGRIK
jgi:hypothetical protein